VSFIRETISALGSFNTVRLLSLLLIEVDKDCDWLAGLVGSCSKNIRDPWDVYLARLRQDMSPLWCLASTGVDLDLCDVLAGLNLMWYKDIYCSLFVELDFNN
jgi:hypothetical protein